jgi:hypothetical protein
MDCFTLRVRNDVRDNLNCTEGRYCAKIHWKCRIFAITT